MKEKLAYKIGYDPHTCSKEERKLIRDSARTIATALLKGGNRKSVERMIRAAEEQEDYERAQGFQRAIELFDTLQEQEGKK